jgi:hypothetical protein
MIGRGWTGGASSRHRWQSWDREPTPPITPSPDRRGVEARIVVVLFAHDLLLVGRRDVKERRFVSGGSAR